MSVKLACDDLVGEADALYRYAITRVRDHHLAEDLVQETLLAAVRKPEGFQGRARLSTWLIGILRNKILDHFRAAARNKEDSLSALNAHAEHEPDAEWFTRSGLWENDPNTGLERLDTDPSDLLERAEVLTAIHACLDRLPTSLQRLYVMRELDDCDPGEICDVLGIARGSLAVLLHRSRQLLRACLQRTWLNS